MTDTVQTATSQAATTPDSVIQWLKQGNQRFVAATPEPRDWLAQVSAAAAGQYPLAAVLGCIDSRVPVETVFDLGIGDAFVTRTAGNVANDDVLGGLEFATEVAGAKAIVVLGHTACGAVKGACDGVELGHLTGLLARIHPAVDAVAADGGNPGGADPAFVDRVVERNVDAVVDAIVDHSAVVSARIGAGDLVVSGAVYDLTTGAVQWRDARRIT